MSAIEQPAFRSGRIDLLVVGGEDVGGLGHELHAAEHDVLGVTLVGGEARQAERVAPRHRPSASPRHAGSGGRGSRAGRRASRVAVAIQAASSSGVADV